MKVMNAEPDTEIVNEGQLLTDKHTINKKLTYGLVGNGSSKRDSQDPQRTLANAVFVVKIKREPICMNQPMVINGKEKKRELNDSLLIKPENFPSKG